MMDILVSQQRQVPMGSRTENIASDSVIDSVTDTLALQ